MTLTETRKRLRALHEAATKGPLVWGIFPPDQDPVDYFRQMLSKRTGKVVNCVGAPDGDKPFPESWLTVAITGNGPTSEDNALLIVEVFEALPALLDALDQAEAALSDAMCGAPDWFDNAAAALAAMKGEASDECSK